MTKGNCPERSTPAEVVSTKRFRSLGQARARLRTDTKSVCSGPLSPSHLDEGGEVGAGGKGRERARGGGVWVGGVGEQGEQ